MVQHFTESLNPLRGKDLIDFFYSDLFQNEVVKKDRIAQGATEALERIKAHYECDLSQDGHSLQAVQKIRDKLYTICGNPKMVNPYTILAPHVHWHDIKPTIYISQKKDEYIIGQHDIKDSSLYYPVTFIFSEMGLIPFEWAEQSIEINKTEHKEIVAVLVELNSSLGTVNSPLGIAIDFRFKKSLFDSPTGSLELPISDTEHPYCGYSKIVPRIEHLSKNDSLEFEQVSWHPRSDLFDGFNEKEIQILNHYRKELRQLKSNKEREAFISQLEKDLIS